MISKQGRIQQLEYAIAYKQETLESLSVHSDAFSAELRELTNLIDELEDVMDQRECVAVELEPALLTAALVILTMTLAACALVIVTLFI